MSYKTSLIDLIEDEVDAINFEVEIQSVALNGDGDTVITTCDIFHAQPLYRVAINDIVYTIKAISGTTQIIIAGDITGALSGVTAFDMYRPYFFHGTPIATNAELEHQNKAINKTPMVWLLENYRQVFYEDDVLLAQRDSYFDLFFLTSRDENWTTGEAYYNAIEPMSRMAETFIAQLKSRPGTFKGPDFEYEIEPFAKFGVYIANRGMEKSLFSDLLAGVRVRFSPLTILKTYECPCP